MTHEKSKTFKYKSDWVNVASIVKGKQKTQKELIGLLNSGDIKPLGKYRTINNAEIAAFKRSKNYKKKNNG